MTPKTVTASLLRISARLLLEAGDEFSNHGCNDFVLLNTPENREFVTAMLQDSEQPLESALDEREQIYINDWQAMHYCSKSLAYIADHVAPLLPVTMREPEDKTFIVLDENGILWLTGANVTNVTIDEKTQFLHLHWAELDESAMEQATPYLRQFAQAIKDAGGRVPPMWVTFGKGELRTTALDRLQMAAQGWFQSVPSDISEICERYDLQGLRVRQEAHGTEYWYTAQARGDANATQQQLRENTGFGNAYLFNDTPPTVMCESTTLWLRRVGPELETPA